MKTEANAASFKVSRINLVKILQQLNINVPNKKRRIGITCEMTIIKDLVSFTVPGATFALPVKTMGSAKATFDLKVIIKMVKMFTQTELTISVEKERVSINSFNFRAMTTLFEDDSILRSVILPINYSDMDLVSIGVSNRYTIEELKFNKLWVLINQANSRLAKRIDNAKNELAHYGITKEEIEELLNKKIQIHIT